MMVNLTDGQLRALLDFAKDSEDAEQLADNHWTLDVFDVEPPLSIEFERCEGGIDALSAFELLYSEADDGWYLGDKIEDAGELAARLGGWPLLA